MPSWFQQILYPFWGHQVLNQTPEHPRNLHCLLKGESAINTMICTCKTNKKAYKQISVNRVKRKEKKIKMEEETETGISRVREPDARPPRGQTKQWLIYLITFQKSCTILKYQGSRKVSLVSWYAADTYMQVHIKYSWCWVDEVLATQPKTAITKPYITYNLHDTWNLLALI